MGRSGRDSSHTDSQGRITRPLTLVKYLLLLMNLELLATSRSYYRLSMHTSYSGLGQRKMKAPIPPNKVNVYSYCKGSTLHLDDVDLRKGAARERASSSKTYNKRIQHTRACCPYDARVQSWSTGSPSRCTSRASGGCPRRRCYRGACASSARCQ